MTIKVGLKCSVSRGAAVQKGFIYMVDANDANLPYRFWPLNGSPWWLSDSRIVVAGADTVPVPGQGSHSFEVGERTFRLSVEVRGFFLYDMSREEGPLRNEVTRLVAKVTRSEQGQWSFDDPRDYRLVNIPMGDNYSIGAAVKLFVANYYLPTAPPNK